MRSILEGSWGKPRRRAVIRWNPCAGTGPHSERYGSSLVHGTLQSEMNWPWTLVWENYSRRFISAILVSKSTTEARVLIRMFFSFIKTVLFISIHFYYVRLWQVNSKVFFAKFELAAHAGSCADRKPGSGLININVTSGPRTDSWGANSPRTQFND